MGEVGRFLRWFVVVVVTVWEPPWFLNLVKVSFFGDSVLMAIGHWLRHQHHYFTNYLRSSAKALYYILGPVWVRFYL